MYTYDDLRNPENNCIYGTLRQVANKVGMSYSTLRNILSGGDVYYDRRGAFKIERRVYHKAKSMSRR